MPGAGLPDLAALVVRKDTGMPGGGWFDPTAGRPGRAWAEALAACFAHPWPARPDPGSSNPGADAEPRLTIPRPRTGEIAIIA